MALARRLLLTALAAPAVARAQGMGQGWAPDRSITLLHGFGAGGAADTICRILAPPLAEALGRPVVVEPRPGAGGNIASAALARAPADGHTLGLLTGSHGVAAAFGKATGFDPVDSFAWISVALRYAFVLVARADGPYRDLRALVAAAKARPGAVQYGTLGPGSSHHLTGELFSAAAGIEMGQVPYRSDVAGITAVLGGELPLMVSTSVGAMGLLQDPKLRGLGVTADRRSGRFPAIPTVAASGFPDFRSYTWAGLAAPAATPAPVIAAVHAALLRSLAQPAVRTKLEELTDGEVDPSAPTATRALVVEEIAAWRGLITARGLSAE
ncbi:tripartite tricarboxylate transporter substrate binding protein [Dankookia rubra]|uniref:Tripartite tricarboxylate transporter substrate binding protein n=1 Tax=Dankookia rubra TaxID=1442381 RepID=A0A4R5QJQ2_9PROT|nr:tripartite tricarboxylate transporter substrate-binding protein [Dankookia rubra]TDH63650.1 tripartite tricarboxylate transporter substrate binding protein [Dankookia rubra]